MSDLRRIAGVGCEAGNHKWARIYPDGTVSNGNEWVCTRCGRKKP